MTTPVYLDNHATTRVDPRVVDVMLPLMTEGYGNAASRQHVFGWEAEAAVELARKRVAALIGARPEEVVFTSGATESINLAMKGIAESGQGRGNHIVIAATEHRAVLDTAARLTRYGFTVATLSVDGTGRVEPDAVAASITPETILVCLMAANNEIGTLHPVMEIGAVCRERGVLFHTDATQAVGKIPVDVSAWNVDMMSFSAHKMHGPKGAGALYLRGARPRVRLVPLIDGGGHERGLRSGTLNVPAIAGFGMAAEIVRKEMDKDSARVRALRDRLVAGLLAGVPGIRVNGHPVERLPHNANITFPGIQADAMMMAMKDIAVSSGSACSTASPEPSHVLRAIGLSREDALSSLRFGLSRFTNAGEIDYAIDRVTETARALMNRRRLDVPAL
ncbi:MAG: cysteine desulfurase family protein [Bacteroidota bacterium]